MTSRRVAIIGAGASGLSAIKQCVADGLEPVCFEQNDSLGGQWYYQDVNDEHPDPHSSAYESLSINTTKQTSAFSDFPMPDDWPVYMSHRMLCRYFGMYAEHFDLEKHIRFRTMVIRAYILSDERWSVKYVTNGQPEHEEVFDYLMVCTGHHRKHRWPKYEGMHEFGGEQMHSHFYRVPDKFKNKRVLIVGIGSSSMDISVELSRSAEVYLSTRRGTLPWIIPRFFAFGIPADQFSSRSLVKWCPGIVLNWIAEWLVQLAVGRHPPGLKPSNPLLGSHPTVNSDFWERYHMGCIRVKPDIARLHADKSVAFTDGTIVRDVDAIIYCIGYNVDFPFLDRDIISGGHQTSDEFEPEYRENVVWLYRTIAPPRVPNIAFLGLLQSSSAFFPVCEMQARYVTAIINGRLHLPPPNEMEQQIIDYYAGIRRWFYHSARHTIEINGMMYCDMLAREVGCYPFGLQVLREHGLRTWKNLMFGSLIAAQYRLVGWQKWDEAADWLNACAGYKKQQDEPAPDLLHPPAHETTMDQVSGQEEVGTKEE